MGTVVDMKDFDPSSLPQDQITPLVEKLLRVIQNLQEEVRKLKEEINILKGQKGRPEIKPSTLEKPKRTRDSSKSNHDDKPPLERKRGKYS